KQVEQEIKIRNQIAKIFLTVPDEDMYADVLNIILESLDSKYGVFGYISEKGALVVPTMTRTVWDKCEVKEKDIVFPKETWGSSSWPRAIREKKPNYTNKTSNLTPTGHIPIERHINMPIVHRGECVGLLMAANKKTDYDQRDLELLQNIADYIAPVLNARLQRDRQNESSKKVEEELRQSEKRYRSYIEVTGQLGWITNAKGEVAEDIPTWSAYTGQSYDEMKGWGWTEAIHPDDRERTSEIWQEAIKTKSKYETEFRVRGKDGKYRWFLSRALPFLDEKGSILEWIGTCIDIHDKKQAQEALQESEEKYRKLYESMMDAFVSTNIEGNIIEFNQAYLNMLEYNEDDITKLTYIDLTPKKWHKMESKIVEDQILKKGYSDVYEKEYIKKDGTVIPVELRTFLLKDKEGKPSGMWAIVRDITKRKKAEEELRIKENAIQSSLNAIAISDLKGNLTYINPSFMEIWGYSDKNEILGKSATEFCEMAEKAKEVLNTLEQEGEWFGELLGRRKDGTSFPVQVAASMVLDESGKPVSLMSSFIDITQQKKAEEELRKSEELYRAITTNLPGGLIHIFDRDFKYVFNSGEELERLGLSNEMLLGKSIHEILPSETAKKVENNYRRVLKGETVRFEDSFEGNHFLVTATPLRDEKNKISNILVSSLNITERKKAELQINQLNTELQSKNKELEQLLYTTSHDLRSPLVNVEGFSRELQGSLKDLNNLITKQEISEDLKNKLKPIIEENIPESLKYILTSTSKMDRLLSGLLTLSRLGRQKLTIKNLDMDKLMKDVVSTFEYGIKEKNIKLDIFPLPNCRGDELQINQVFSNLLGNALKFSDPDRTGVIKISGQKKKDHVIYSVEDNGIGIPADHQKKIFDLFHQLDPKASGRGLGLNIVKKILDKHKGDIQIDSKKGKGTRITVSLPSQYKGGSE
ncbi:MAG: PAS domain S-box protein, partial [Candidatus Aminicenantes bacterium]|nr:PAS domain S-box protein [Candidatus Aminicenantes bacterium]